MSSNGAPDSKRPLTSAGIKRMQSIGKGLCKALDGDIQRIITSPYTRAQQTAQLIHTAIPENQRPELDVSDLLTPGASVNTIKSWLTGKTGTIALIGHEPDMSWFIQEFCGAPSLRTKFSKAGACLIYFESDPGNSGGSLQWLMGPSLLHRLGSQ